MPQTGVRNSVRDAISSQIAGTWCCQQPPPRKLSARLAVDVARQRALAGGATARPRRRAPAAARSAVLVMWSAGIWANSSSASATPTAAQQLLAQRRRRVGHVRMGCAGHCCSSSSLARDVHDDLLARADVDAHVAAADCASSSGSPVSTHSVGGASASSLSAALRIVIRSRPIRRQHARAELPVAAPEQRTLAADQPDDQPRIARCRSSSARICSSVRSRPIDTTVADGIDAEQRAAVAERGEHGAVVLPGPIRYRQPGSRSGCDAPGRAPPASAPGFVREPALAGRTRRGRSGTRALP